MGRSTARHPADAAGFREARDSTFLWLTASIGATAFAGFSLTYFTPIASGTYPDVSPAVHVHGWSFFAWYLLLPLQALLIRRKRTRLHRALGAASVALVSLMVSTGLLVLGTRLDAAIQAGGDPFWSFMGLAIFTSLLLFVGFYALALKHRRRAAYHKRFMILAGAGGLGAATFRIVGALLGFGPVAGVVGVFVPNVFILAGVAADLRRGAGLHPVYKVGLPVSVVATALALLVTPTRLGVATFDALAWIGRLLAPLY